MPGSLSDPDTIGGEVPSTRTPTTIDAPRRITEIHTAASDQGREYGIWGAGADYKASFHNGMTFVPYLGSDYPHNQPFSWSTRSVKIGSTELATNAPKTHQQPARFEYDLGGVVEAYDLRIEGLEQTFIIERAPTQLGDLVVQGRIDTLLTATAAKAAHQALQFVDHDGEPIVSYGKAFVVDASGRKVPMATAYADGVITLSLAVQQLEELTFPIVVDPLVGNISLRLGTGIPLEPVMDCLREDEGVTDNVWYTYSRAVSATDNDLWIWRVNDQWVGTDLLAYSDLTASWSTFEPQIASASGANRTVTVFTRDFGTTRFLRWHTHDYSDLTSNSSVGFYSLSGHQVWRPDVGGTESFTTGSTAMVVFQAETATTWSNTTTSSIYALPIDVSGTGQGTPGTPVALNGTAAIDFERPRINQQSEGGASPIWIVTHQEYNNTITGDDWDLGARAIDATGNSASSTLYTESASSDHKMGPIVAGQDGRYSIIYAIVPIASVGSKPSAATGYDMRVRRLDFDGTSLSWNSNLSSIGELGLVTSSLRWLPTGIAADTDSSNHWLVAFRSTGSNSVYTALTGYRGGYVSRDTLGSSDFLESGGVTYDDDSDEFLVMYGENDGATNPLFGDIWQYTTAPSEVMTGTSCSPVVLMWSGAGTQLRHEHQIGNGECVLSATAAPSRAIHFMVMSLATADVPVVSSAVGRGCRSLVDSTGRGYLGILDFKIGASVSWDLQLPEFLVGDTIYFQDWHTNNSATLYFSSQRLELQIVE